MSSPLKESFSTLAPTSIPSIQAPPSPRSHRTLRRLNSAHNLGSNKPSLISQQRQQQTVLNLSPGRRDQTAIPTSSFTHQRTRSNSDVAVVGATQDIGTTSKKQINTKRSLGNEVLSLDRLIRDGPNHDLAGALETTRLKILDQGIKSDSDGMVS